MVHCATTSVHHIVHLPKNNTLTFKFTNTSSETAQSPITEAFRTANAYFRFIGLSVELHSNKLSSLMQYGLTFCKSWSRLWQKMCLVIKNKQPSYGISPSLPMFFSTIPGQAVSCYIHQLRQHGEIPEIRCHIFLTVKRNIY